MDLSERSRKNLKGVHTDLVNVVLRAAKRTTLEFMIIEGVRSRARQEQLFKSGATRTLNSRHLTGHAIDFVPLIGGKIEWKWPAFIPVAEAFKAAAAGLKIPIVWGGDWKSFRDGPHIELDRKSYP